MYIKVMTTPAAKKESIEKMADDKYKIAVKEPAERNLANKRVIELLAAHYQVSIGKVRLLHGHHSRSKLFSVDN